MAIERIRFHLDEQVDPDIGRALRSYGIDVTTTVESRLRTASDETQLAYAIRSGRVIVTHDADFLRLAAASPEHPGIAYCRQNRRTLGEIVRTLLLLYEVMSPAEMKGQVEYL
jgi:predicted nuclease of predicted toxin-antitoxin system